MAQFTNQAQLSYNGQTVNSNIAVGEIPEAISASKTAVGETYTEGGTVTYVISAVNSALTPATGVTVSDDLGGYLFGTETLYPLRYLDGSVRLFINGILQAAPTVTAGPPLVFEGITIPANGNMVLVYDTTVTQFAPLGTTDSIVNTATLTGAGIPTPITVSETVTPVSAPSLSITKSIEPPVVNEGGRVNYRFVIQNFGSAPADACANVTVTDLFDPILSDLVVTLDSVTLAENTDYTYVATDGLFTTTPGRITVDAATYAQDPATGTWSVTPGTTTLTVSGTI